MVGIAVQVAAPGNVSALAEGAVGIGPTRAEAIDTAIVEWAKLAGVGFIRAIAVREAPRRCSRSGGSASTLALPGFADHRGSRGHWPGTSSW